MEFLRFQSETPLFVPKVFLSAFVPGVRVLAPQVLSLAQFFENHDFPLVEAARVKFSLSQPLVGSARVQQAHTATMLDAACDLTSEPADGIYFVGASPREEKILAIRTADCLPLMLSANIDGVMYCAAVHAGWKGFVQGIHIHAVEILALEASRRGVAREAFLSALSVFVGPGIFGASYECGPEVKQGLEAHLELRIASLVGFAPWRNLYRECIDVACSDVPRLDASSFRADRVHPDLQLLACIDFASLGLSASRIQVLRENTWGSSVLHSYRYAKLRGGGQDARIVSHLIVGPARAGVA
jgi:copper oxidase (laccase) domain-containing protein